MEMPKAEGAVGRNFNSAKSGTELYLLYEADTANLVSCDV